jgi:hypothetical protein
MEKQEQQTWRLIAGRSKIGAACLVVTTVLIEALVVEPVWHLQPNDAVVAVTMWIVGGLATGLMAFGIGIEAFISATSASQKERQENRYH